MKAGMTLAIISGVVALLFGVVMTLFVGAIGGAAGIFGASDAAAKSGIVMVVLLGLPIMCVVGGALANSNAKAATWLTGIPGLVIAGSGFVNPEKGVLLIILGGMMLLSSYFIFNGSKKKVEAEVK